MPVKKPALLSSVDCQKTRVKMSIFCDCGQSIFTKWKCNPSEFITRNYKMNANEYVMLSPIEDFLYLVTNVVRGEPVIVLVNI